MHTKKRTKIIATIGPATEDPSMIKDLILEGVNVFRFNLKHNDLNWHVTNVNKVRQIAKDLGIFVGILLDLQGPDIRIGSVFPESLELKTGDKVIIGDSFKDTFKYPFIELEKRFVDKIKRGQEIVIDDGNFVFKTLDDAKDGFITCVVEESGGVLTHNKGIFFPNLDMNVPALSPKDKDNLKIAQQVQPEFLALSFVRHSQDILDLKKEMKRHNLEDSKIVAKIETKLALKNIDGILEESQGIMVARGDLGVEIHLEAVPAIQKKLIRKARKRTKFVIVATQMLKSMVNNPYPTRAEVSDVANASYDLADAVMLSEETAIGKYPLRAVKIMAKTLRFNEVESLKSNRTAVPIFKTHEVTEAIVISANNIQRDLEHVVTPKAFLVLTESGRTAKLLSALRPLIPIFSISQRDFVAQHLSLCWGVLPFSTKFKKTTDASVQAVISMLKEKGVIEPGDALIVISGQNIGVPGQTDSLRVLVTT